MFTAIDKDDADRSRSPVSLGQLAKGVPCSEAPPAWAQMLLQRLDQGQRECAGGLARLDQGQARLETHVLSIGNRVEAVEANQAELARQLEAVTLRVAAMEEARTCPTGAASDAGSTCVSLGGVAAPSDLAPSSGLSSKSSYSCTM